MKFSKYIAFALTSLLTGTLVARATDIDLQFSYQDSNGLVSGNADLIATPLAGEPGAYTATVGTLVLKAPAADQIAGDYQLFPNQAAPTPQYSPTGRFIYDDLVLPGANPVVTNPGVLAFGGPGQGSVPEGKGSEINFYSNGANTYDLYTSVNGNYPYSYQFMTPRGSAKATVVASFSGGGKGVVSAPEPSSWLIMGSFALIALWNVRSRKGFRK
jgi:hypothetical protein